MSLDYNLSKIPLETRTIVAEHDDPTYGIKAGERIMNPVTNTLIWSTMIIGIGVINDETLEEFVARIDLHQKINGPLMQTVTEDGVEPRPITREDIEAHMGLSTNVFPMETRTAWVTRSVTKDPRVFPKPEPKRKR